jgi:hypothetical protein
VCRYKAVLAKERKALFNEFCANAVEERTKVESERKERTAAHLRELFHELLGVTPLQFRLFREGRSLEEVELESDAEVTLRTAEIENLNINQRDDSNSSGAKQEEKEEGEADDGPEAGPPALNTSAAAESTAESAFGDIPSLKEAILDADLEIRPGGLFGPGTTLEDVHDLVAADERWKECPEDVKAAVFEEVLRPLIVEREAADVALRERVLPAVRRWLAELKPGPRAAWEDVEASRRGLVAKVPDRIVRTEFEEHVAALSAKLVRAWSARLLPDSR